MKLDLSHKVQVFFMCSLTHFRRPTSKAMDLDIRFLIYLLLLFCLKVKNQCLIAPGRF